jgi:NADH-quinone oxidoreductase subunit A
VPRLNGRRSPPLSAIHRFAAAVFDPGQGEPRPEVAYVVPQELAFDAVQCSKDFPWHEETGRRRQNSLSCAPCCAALSLRTIPMKRICGRQMPQEKAPPMAGILQNYLPLVVFIGVASLIGLALLIAPFLVAFQQPDPEKLSAYECGFNAFDDARMKFEVAFLFPWAVAFGKLGATGFWSMMVFLAVLTIGFAYEWKKGALEWD